MFRQTLMSAFVLAVLVNTALAGNPAVGSDAPDLVGLNWVLNEPQSQKNIKDCKGDVVVVEQWGCKCGPCVALIPHLNELYKKEAPNGLHVFACEAQGHSAADIKKLMEPKGVVYPVSAGGANNYDGGPSIPHAWVIGVNGKVIWEGNPTSPEFQKAIEAELQKVKTPGLGKTDIAKELKGAAAKFKKGDFVGARKEAKQLAESEKSSDEAKADAQFVVERVTGVAKGRLEAAKSLEAAKDYLGAIDLYEWVAKAFKGEEEGVAADARVKELKADKEVKREIDAAAALAKILSAVTTKPGQAPDYKSAVPALKSMIKKFEGTKAASDAQRLVDSAGATAGK